MFAQTNKWSMGVVLILVMYKHKLMMFAGGLIAPGLIKKAFK